MKDELERYNYLRKKVDALTKAGPGAAAAAASAAGLLRRMERKMAVDTAKINLRAKLNEIARRHIIDALILAEGNKTRAAELLGFSSYQTLSNWMKRLGIE
jgi:transcriptional regulator with GAF, ATPase, and Fis domain